MGRLSARSTKLFVAYVLTVGTILGVAGLLLVAHEDGLLTGLLAAVLPDGLVDVGRAFVDPYIAANLPAVLTLMVTVVVAGVPALTFPLKEKLSAAYEDDTDPDGEPNPPEPPLWRQAWDEAWLLVLMGSLALGAFRLAVTPGFEAMGTVLANVVLAVTSTVDFVGPTHLRRGKSAVDVCKIVLLRHPISALMFGGAMALVTQVPTALMQRGVLSPTTGTVLLVVLYALTFGVAVLVGTHLATRQRTEGDTPAPLRAVVLAASAGLLAFNVAFFGAAALAVYHVSPVLKCEWSIALETVDFELPGLTDPSLSVAFDVAVTNPTSRTASIDEGAVVHLFHDGDAIADTPLPVFEVPAGETVTQPIAIRVDAKGGLAKKGLAVLSDAFDDGIVSALGDALSSATTAEAYRVVLTVPLPTGELTVPLYDGAGGDDGM